MRPNKSANLIAAMAVALPLILSSTLPAGAQEGIIKLNRLLETSAAQVPGDQVYIHTDRNLYHPDDTIFFQSYVRNRFTLIHETKSRSIYLILSGEDGEIIDSARFRIDHSLAPGYLKIPNNVSPGYYKLVAFTGSMQNFDPEYAFSTWIRIDQAKPDEISSEFFFDSPHYSPGDTAEITILLTDNLGEPLKNEPFLYSLVLDGKNNDYFNSKTNREGESLVRIYLPDSSSYRSLSLELSLDEKNYLSRITIPRDTDRPDLRFLPEGGNLIYDHPQRLAFNAVTTNGKQVYVRGSILDDSGSVITTFESGDYGPGMVEFTPSSGHSYHALLEDFPGFTFPLPCPEDHSYALRADAKRNLINVDIAEINTSGDSCYLVLSMNKKIITIQPLLLKDRGSITFDTGELPPGTMNVTLFDNSLNPVAERLVMINAHKQATLEYGSRYQFYVGGQESELSINLNDENGGQLAGFFSIAVIDSLSGFYPDIPWLNIRESFLFDNDFYNNLPVRIRSEGLTGIPAEEIDLLLMTYGWRRFTWTEMDYQANGMQNYDLLRVRILDRMSRRRMEKMSNNSDNLVLMTVEYPGIHSLMPGDTGSFYFPFDSLGPYNNRIIIAPGNRAEKYITGAKIEFPSNSTYLKSLIGKDLSRPSTIKDDFFLSHEPDLEMDSVRKIADVTVWGKRTPEKRTGDDFIWKYQTVSSRTLDQDDIKKAVAFDQLLRELNPLYINQGTEQIFFRPQQSLLGGPTMPPALFVLDGLPIGNDYSLLANMNPRDISFITAVKGSEGFYLYGEVANGGVVFVETKIGNWSGQFETESNVNEQFRGDLSRPVEVFRPAVEFYNPPEEQVKNNPELWRRSTIYWNPEIFCDGESASVINYFNHLKKGPVLVIINGVSVDNRPITGRFRYLVR